MRLLDSGKVLLKQLTMQGETKEGSDSQDVKVPDDALANDARQFQSHIPEQLKAYKVSSSFLNMPLLNCENQIMWTLSIFLCYTIYFMLFLFGTQKSCCKSSLTTLDECHESLFFFFFN